MRVEQNGTLLACSHVMIIFAAASLGALVDLCCKACGERQARARGPADATYACRKCGRPIKLARATPPSEPPR